MFEYTKENIFYYFLKLISILKFFNFYILLRFYLLLTYLTDYNNPINGFRPAATHPSRRLCFLHAFDDRASPIWSFQRIQGRPVRRLPQIPASNTHLAGASSSIRTTWPSQRSHWILIRCTTSMSLRSSYSSLLIWMRKSSPTRIGPMILCRTFLLNTLTAVSSVLNRRHASAP